MLGESRKFEKIRRFGTRADKSVSRCRISFTKGVNEIAKSDRSTLDILIGYDSNLDESF